MDAATLLQAISPQLVLRVLVCVSMVILWTHSERLYTVPFAIILQIAFAELSVAGIEILHEHWQLNEMFCIMSGLCLRYATYIRLHLLMIYFVDFVISIFAPTFHSRSGLELYITLNIFSYIGSAYLSTTIIPMWTGCYNMPEPHEKCFQSLKCFNPTPQK